MKTQLRDDVLSKNKQFIRLLMTACLSLSISVVVLAGLTVYGLFSQVNVYIPTHMSESFKLSKLSVSPSYLRQMATDLMQLRLTWNPETITQSYTQLLDMVALQNRNDIRKSLNAEIATVKRRHMSSVFYQNNKVLVDSKALLVRVSGDLQRIDDGVVLASVEKHYQIQFSYHLGLLSVISIKEVKANA